MIRVYRLKDLIKYFVLIVIGIVLICVGINLLKNKKAKNKNETKKVNSDLYLYCLDDSLKESKEYESEKNLSKFILSKELLNIEDDNNSKKNESNQIANNNNTNGQIDNLKDNNVNSESENSIGNKKDENQNLNSVDNKESNTDNENLKASTDVKVEVISNNVKPRVTYTFQGVQINNIAEKNLNDDLLNCDNLNVNKNKILIYHTHTCESYTPTEENNYTPSGNYRTTDLSHSVVAVGDELENQLKLYGVNVIHNKTYHDYPAYNGSYSRSLETINPIILENKDIDISIDLHRDAIADSSYAPKVKIGDEYVSQMMFVIGTDLGDKRHKDWIENLRFAIKAQKKANELYPRTFQTNYFEKIHI